MSAAPSKDFDLDLFYRHIAPRLKEKYQCPVCRSNHFTLNRRYSALFLNDTYKAVSLETILPCAIVTCRECGHVDLFSMPIVEEVAANE